MTELAKIIEELRTAASSLLPLIERDRGATLIARWQGGETASTLDAPAVVADRLAMLCRSRATAESLATALPAGVADLAMVWAESAAYRGDVVLSPLVAACAAARPAYRIRAAKARFLNGPLFDALHALPGFWGEHRDVMRRLRQLVWEAGARGLSLGVLGRWMWSVPSAIEEIIVRPARGHLGDCVLAARALAVFAEGFAEDTAPAQARSVLGAAFPLCEHADAAVWTAAARGLGRLTLGSSSARMLVFRATKAAELSARRRNITALASMPVALGAETWIAKQIDDVLAEDARKRDPWMVAALAVATPHLARERPEAWERLCALAIEDPSAELVWSLAQGLAILGRHSGGRGWVAAEAQIARELRARLVALAPDSSTEVARQLEAIVNLDRALALEPSLPLCLDMFDARIRTEVEGAASPNPVLPRAAFEAELGNLDSEIAPRRGRAMLALRSATRAHAMHLQELVLGEAVRDADTDFMLDECRRRLLDETCSHGKRSALVGATTDLVSAKSIAGAGTGHGRSAARALRTIAASRWVHDVERDALVPEKARQLRRDIARFRKPLEDLFHTALAPRPALVGQDETVPPVVAAWWTLCAGPAFVLGSIERGDDDGGLSSRIGALESALAGAANTKVVEWGPRAQRALAGLDAADTVLGEVFDRLIDVIAEVENTQTRGNETEANRLAGALTAVCHAFLAVTDDLDDAFAPRSSGVVGASVGDRPQWIAVPHETVHTTGPGVAEKPWLHLAPSLRALVTACADDIDARLRAPAKFVAKTGIRFGPFELHERIARGGMGEVWRATYEGVRQVALKLPRVDVTEEDRLLLAEVLRKEAATMARIHFAKVAMMLASGVIEDTPYLATTFIRGRTLDEHLIEDPTAETLGRHLPLVQRIVEDVCIGLDDLHRHGYVHRDLKPSNIMLRMRGRHGDPLKPITDDPDGREMSEAVLIDFGIAHEFNSGAGFGATPGYAAPETVDEDALVGPAADVYALGATLFEVFTGYTFTRERPAQVAVVWHTITEPFEDADVLSAAKVLPQRIRQAIEGATRRAPEKRISLERFRGLVCDP